MPALSLPGQLLGGVRRNQWLENLLLLLHIDVSQAVRAALRLLVLVSLLTML